MLNKIKTILNKNKYLFFLLSFVFICLVYCSLNTLIMNDDLGYSLLYRTSTRITNIFHVIKMQISDYKIVSSRVFIHSIVQALLIYGKSLWSILNPIVIILNYYFINKIIKLYVKDKNNKIISYTLGLICFMLLVTYKWLIYWVAGSVNYVWTSTLLFVYIYLYLKNDIIKNKWINMLLFLIVSILHESTFIFCVIFLISDILHEYLFNKNIIKEKLLLFIPLIISAIFLFLGPGTFSRMNAYNNLSFLEKFKVSLPVVSINIYNLKDINNIIPTIFIFLTIIKLFKYKENIKYIFITLNISIIVLALLLNVNWFYFILSVSIFLTSIYINYKDNRNKLSVLLVSYYAVSYSLCLTTEYVSGRPNYFISIYMIFLIILYTYDVINKKYIKYLIFPFIGILICLMIREVYIYNKIGQVKKERLIAIEKYKNKETDKLYYKKINENYYLYQIDLNEPLNDEYYAYKYFLDYYNLPSDTIIEFID